MAKNTKYLLFISILLSAASILIPRLGQPEIYPFSAWKLFPGPMGSTKSTSEFRLYGLVGGDTIRISNTDSVLYTGNQKFKVINLLSGKIMKDSTNLVLQEELYKFAKIIAPVYDSFLVISEQFNPQLLYTDSFSYQKTVLIKLK